MDEAEGEESASLSASAPYLGLVGMQIDDEPYTPSPSSAFITATPGILEASLHAEEIPAEQGGIDYDLSGLTPERFDHDAAKARLKQYKKEAEERKRKKMLAQQREAERLNAEMAREREKMSVIQTAREAEAKQKAQERFERQRQEREERARAREELKHANRSPVRTGVPLYKRREMEMERIKQQEENLRRQKLRQHQEHFKQIDFIALEREAREAKRQQQYDDFGSSRPTRINPREKINLPPVNSQYYHGNAMNRVREHRDVVAAMFLTRSEYDRGVNTFSPEGRLFQVEYAIEAIKIGTTAIGISTKEGVVIAVEKRLLSPLQEPSSVEKLFEVDSHIGVAMSGLSADARTLVDHARSEAQYHRFTYNEPMPVESLTQSVCDLALGFGESEGSKMARPFGVALLIAGWDLSGPTLFHTDPSGTYTKFGAKAIGAGAEGAQTALQEQYHKNLTLEEAETMAVTILKQVMEEKLDASNVEVASVRMPTREAPAAPGAACHYVPGAAFTPAYTTYGKEELEKVLARVNADSTATA